MNTKRPAHAQISIEHNYEATPHAIFAAWADEAAKSRWFRGPGNWTLIRRELDFTVGGTELLEGRFDNGSLTTYIAQYHEIVADERLVYSCDIFVNDTLHSVSIVTVEFLARGLHTHLRYTEQIVFLDGTLGEEGAAAHRAGNLAHLSRLASLFND